MQTTTLVIFYSLYGLSIMLLLSLLYVYLRNIEKFGNFLKKSLIVSIVMFLLYWVNQILNLYATVKASPMSQYLMAGRSSFFWQKTMAISVSSLISLFAVVVIYLLILWILRKQKKPFLDEAAPAAIFVSLILTGFIQIIPLLIGAFLLAILYQLFLLVVKKRQDNLVSITPFIILVALVIRVLMIFPFYDNFLGWLHLM